MNTTAIRVIVVLVIIVIILVSSFLLFNSSESHTTGQTASEPIEKVNPEKIAGRWQRTDGGYIIEVKSVHNDGTLDAAYLNPNPINVAISEWSRIDGQLQIYVELSDVNYPGSYYKLFYFPDQDQLLGIYHQAVYKQNYEVQFIRLNGN
jgi:hypothetical protein